MFWFVSRETNKVPNNITSINRPSIKPKIPKVIGFGFKPRFDKKFQTNILSALAENPIVKNKTIKRAIIVDKRWNKKTINLVIIIHNPKIYWSTLKQFSKIQDVEEKRFVWKF